MRFLLPGLLLILSCCFASCDASVDPFLETERYFTLFGTLDMAQDTQFVRVIPLRFSLEDTSSSEPLDVTFTSEDLTTGIQRSWQDSVVTFSNGAVGHIYYAPMRMKAGHTYRITVTKGDSVSTVTTAVPSRPVPRVMPPELFGGTVGRADGTQMIVWQQLEKQPFSVEVWYRFLPTSGGAVGSSFIDILIPNSPAPEVDRLSGGWGITIDLDENRTALDTLTDPYTFPLLGVGMRITVLDEDFEPPGGVFDRDLQTQPGAFSNVEKGFGFVGSVGRFSVEWAFTEETAHRLRYVTLDDLYGKRRAARIRARLRASGD